MGPVPLDALNPNLLTWLRECIRRGRDMSVVVQHLRQKGFSDAAIVRALEAVRPRGDALAGGAMQAPPLIRRAPPGLRRIEAAGFPLYTLEHFLDAQECAGLIEMVHGHLLPSAVSNSYAASDSRTSTSANLHEIDDPRAAAVEQKVCRTLGIREPYAEGVQAQRYEVGQQFKPHYDAFEPGTTIFQRCAGMRGNRTWTFMVYLNEGMDGGATRFTTVDVAVRPRLGMALLWNNLLDDGTRDPRTLHAGEPVTRGFKVILTQWFRVHGDGPVLHE